VTAFWKIIASFILPVYAHDAERQSLAAVAFASGGFTLGGVSETPAMTRAMALHG
jgi:hypothetical protein